MIRCVVVACLAGALHVQAQIVISGNENKIDLASGSAQVVPGAQPDSISILDFSRFPPDVHHILRVSNTVIGPPSNIGIAPGGKLALIADSVRVDPADATKTVPARAIHILDLSQKPPVLAGQVEAGLQPSGMSFTPDGRLALVANRADGTISVLKVDGTSVRALGAVPVCEPIESISDVAVHPGGRHALASVQKGGYLALLEIQGDQVKFTGRKISVYGQPYRCVISPDGAFALTAGQGFGNGLDLDALSVVDLKGLEKGAAKTVAYVPIGTAPESIEISPNGKLVAAVLMNGSNLPAGDPNATQHGGLVILERKGNGSFAVVQEVKIGRIPEGVAFTSDGKYLVVQCHPDRELWVYAVEGNRVRDTGRRIGVPGMPSSLRAAP